MSAVAITGMHRSGTSMVAKALRLAGLHLGDESDFIPPAPDNPEGFFEHRGFVRLADDLLAAAGGAWYVAPPCPPMGAGDPRLGDLRERADALIATVSGADAWGWKDPRLCLTARFWSELVPDLKFVVVVRHPLEVAESLNRRNQISPEYGLDLWRRYYEALLGAVPAARRIVTHYDTYFTGAEAEMERLLEFAGLEKARSSSAAGAVNPERRSHRASVGLASAGVAPDIVDLYSRLCEEAEVVLPQDAPDGPGPRPDATQAFGPGPVYADIDARLSYLEDALDEVTLAAETALRPDGAVVRGCRRLVRRHVPAGERVLVVGKDDPLLLDVAGRHLSNFPQGADGSYLGYAFAHGLSAMAHLESLRATGHHFLLVPETSAWWIEHYPDFAEHVLCRYRVVADEADVGVLVDLRQPVTAFGTQPVTAFGTQPVTAFGTQPALPGDGWGSGLAEMFDRLAGVCGREPSVLDWTEMQLGALLPGRGVFEPPPWAGDELPYREKSVDAVLIADGARMAEAHRVAAVAVATVESGRRPTIAAVEAVGPAAPGIDEVPVRFLVASSAPDPEWLEALRQVVAGEPAVEIVVGAHQIADMVGSAEIVAVIEEGVLPLPGCCAAARATLALVNRAGAVAPKLLTSEGRIEAAGATVFADGSYEAVAGLCDDVVAPWHEYAHDTCGAPGLMFLSAAAVSKIGEHISSLPLAAPVAWGAAVWQAGLRVIYQPDAVAVRTSIGAGPGMLAGAVTAERWETALAGRPDRPAVLDEAAWSRLLAHDDIEAVWKGRGS